MKANLYAIVAIAGMAGLTAAAESPVLLRTFNPPPGAGGYFGGGMAALGSDRVLIGAPNHISNPWPPINAAAVHLFHTNGTLLTTFTNPNSASLDFDGDQFGCAIATLGSDRVLIGSPNDGTNKTLVVNPTGQSQFYWLVWSVYMNRRNIRSFNEAS